MAQETSGQDVAKTSGDANQLANKSRAESPHDQSPNPEQVRRTVRQLLGEAILKNNAEDILRAISIWDGAEEAHKHQVEAEHIVRTTRSDNFRFAISLLAPLITAVALVIGLNLQTNQINLNAQVQREATEASEWRNMVQTSNLPPEVGAMVGATLLRSFFDSPRYKGLARQLAVGLLGETSDPEGFQILVPALASTTDSSNYMDLVKMLRLLKRNIDHTLEALKNLPGQPVTARFPPPPGSTSPERISRDEAIRIHKRQLDNLGHSAPMVGDALAKFLRTSPQVGVALDLSDAALWDTDLSRLDLRNANFADTRVESCDLRGTDLSGVSSFDGSMWNFTAWWRAKAVSALLLEYLKKNAGFNPTVQYYGGQATEEEYARELARLTAP